MYVFKFFYEEPCNVDIRNTCNNNNENVIEEGGTKEEFTKRKKYERKKTLHKGKLQGKFVEKTRNIAHEFS